MPTLYRASLGYLLRHPWQLALAILGISIGVAVMVAVDLANESSKKAFIASMNTLNGEATHQIVGGPAGIDDAVYADLRVNYGIRDIAPIVAGYVSIGGTTMQLLGVDLFAEREFRAFTAPLTSSAGGDSGNANSAIALVRDVLAGTPGLVLPEETALTLNLRRNDSVELIANGKRYLATLQGVMSGGGSDGLPEVAVTDIALAQHWLQLEGRLTRIDVKLPDGDDALLEQIREILPPGTELLSAAGRTQTTAAMSDSFMTNLMAMSLLALLVGIFLIYNSVAFAVLQRRDLIGVLRALGVTRAQTFQLILIEALLIGIVGAVIGVTAGIWLGEKLLVLVARTVSDHYFAVNVTDVAIGSFSVVKGIIAGIGATVVAAAIPAMEASSYQPRLAMTRSVIEQRAGSVLPVLAVAGLLLIAMSVALLGISGSNLVAGLCALFMLILGFAFCIPIAVQRVCRILEPIAGRLGGIAGRMAIGGIGKTLSRTGVAIVALSIAVSATIGVSVMVESFRGSVSAWLGTTLQSDVYVGVRRGSLDPVLIGDLVALPGVEAYSTSRRSWSETAEGRTMILALQMAPGTYAGTRLRNGNPDEIWPQFDNENAVLVSDAFAFRQNASPGQFVSLNTEKGINDFKIAAVYQSYDSNSGAIMMSRRTYDRFFSDSSIDSLGLYLGAGIVAEDVIEQLREVSDGRQELIMSSNARIRDMSLQIFDRTFVITNVLYWLAVGVAVIGILGAMLALQLERAKEFGVLRAIGMTPGQTGSLVVVQTGFIGFLSGLASIPLGLVMAWVLIEVINRRAFGWQIDFIVPPAVLAWAMALAVGAALIAGIYPAWTAARTRPALAMREE